MRLRTLLFSSSAALALAAVAVLPAFAKSEGYTLDAVHSSVTFRIKHLNVGFIYGRFNTVSGSWKFDAENPSASSVKVEVKTASIDTNNTQRDDHLRSPEFFGAAQFPTITFTSTAVKKADDTHFDVTGDLSMHGVTKSVTVRMEKTGTGTDPWGGYRMGFEGTLILNRSEFGITYGIDKGTLADEVRLTIAVEGTKDKE